MSQAKIKALYRERIKAWADANDFPLQFQNERFDPPNKPRPEDNIYLRAFVLPASTTSADMGGDHRAYRGVVQIDIVGPKGLGDGFATGIVAALDNLFRVNLVLTDSSGFKVQVIGPVSEEQALSGATTYTIPTSFFYRSDVI